MGNDRSGASFLIVDDDKLFRNLVINQLTQGSFKPKGESTIDEALNCINDDPVDLIILDNMQIKKPNYQVFSKLKKNHPKAAFVMTTSVENLNTLIAYMKDGADDYLPKPFTSEELNLSINNALKKKRLESDLNELELLHAPNTDNPQNYLRKLKLASFDWLIADLEGQNKYMAGHSHRVSRMAVELGQLVGLSPVRSEEIRWGGLLHDVGMIAVDPGIANKPDKLTDEEYRHLMLHASLGPKILKSVTNKTILSIIRHHHDRYDGTGFQQELKGEDIPLGARIVAIADAFDAMTSERPYRAAMSIEDATEELKRSGGSQFDPAFVAAFARKETRAG
jgi:putative two-component system response regulator